MAVAGNLVKNDSEDNSDLVAYWNVSLRDGIHTIEFEHGTISGKRVLRVDGKEIIRRDWMFRLVGDEKFQIGDQHTRCELKVEPLPHFAYSYTLLVAGKPYDKFTESQDKILRCWKVSSGEKCHRIVLERQSLDIWVNGERVETEDVFVDEGTEMRFQLGNDQEAIIRASTTDSKQGVIHKLYINDELIEEDIDY